MILFLSVLAAVALAFFLGYRRGEDDTNRDWRAEEEAREAKVVCPWKPGDFIRLKGGGPIMTVAGEDLEFEEEICGIWIDGEKHMTASFPYGAVETVKRPS